MKVHNFKELIVWQKGIELCKLVYEICAEFPLHEKYNLKSQIERCAVSIPSNIAEGCGRIGNKEFQHFISIANGSAFELETQLILAKEFGFVKVEKINQVSDLITQIEKMIFSLYNSLNTKTNKTL
jgi:four helix bundle protein